MDQLDHLKSLAIMSQVVHVLVGTYDLMAFRNLSAQLLNDVVFDGKSLLEQHRMVYAALGEAMKEKVHAFTFKTYTKAAWSRVLVK